MNEKLKKILLSRTDLTGENARRSKLKKAEVQHCPITDECGFLELVQTRKVNDATNPNVLA